MFIPTWLLVVVIVVVLLSFWRALILAAVLLVLASMCFGLYYMARHEYPAALVAGSPFLIACVWSAFHSALQMRDEKGRLQQVTLTMHLGLNRMLTRGLSDPAAIMESRLNLARRIQLGQNLFTFWKDVSNFPSWYASPSAYPADKRWSSSVIPQSAIKRVKSSELRSFGIEAPDHEHDELVYQFKAGSKDYVLVAREERAPDWIEAPEEHAVRVYVIELPTAAVLEDQIVYASGSYSDHYRYDHIEAFRPGDWLLALFMAADAVRAESEAKFAAFSKEVDAKRASKFS